MQITLSNLHTPYMQLLHVTPACDPCTWSLHVTSSREPCTWFLCNSTQFAELNQLNTSLRFCQKYNFFEAPKIRSVSTWHIT